MKNNFSKKLMSLTLALTLILGMSVTSYADNQGLNDYIKGLKYNPDKVLTNTIHYNQDDSTTSVFNEDGTFTVVEKVKKNIENLSATFPILTSSKEVYPGAVIKADKDFLENNPNEIKLDRAPMNVYVDLPGLGTEHNVVNVEKPSFYAMNGAVNDMVNYFVDNIDPSVYEDRSFNDVPARTLYNETYAKSMNQLQAKFGLGFKELGVPLGLDFEALAAGEKQSYIINVKQIYYTASVEEPKNPAGFFTDDVTAEMMEAEGVNSDVPPMYISEVNYGRSIYINFQTDSKTKDFKAAIQAAIKGVDFDLNGEFKQILDNTEIHAVVLGGGAGASGHVADGTIEGMRKLIKKGAAFNANNPGLPIAYKVNFVKDNKDGKMQSMTDYIETIRHTYDKGELILLNRGGYVAKFFVEWDEIAYKDGKEVVLKHKAHEDNGKKKTSGKKSVIILPANAKNIHVKIIENTGLAGQKKWKTVFEDKNLPLIGKRMIKVHGTTLHPKFKNIVSEKDLW